MEPYCWKKMDEVCEIPWSWWKWKLLVGLLPRPSNTPMYHTLSKTNKCNSLPHVRPFLTHSLLHPGLWEWDFAVASAVRFRVQSLTNIKWSTPALSPWARGLWLIKPSYSLSAGLPLRPEQHFVTEQTVHPLHVVNEKVKSKADKVGPQEGATAGK